MGKYENLIKRLREHQCDAEEDDTQDICEECQYDVIIADNNLFSGIRSMCICGLMNEAADVIEELSAINGRKKIGEWFGEADGYADGELVYDTWSCGCCGKYFPEWDEKPDWNYCPNCGADMRGDKDV